MSDMYSRFVLGLYRPDGACRAYLGATCTLGSAETALEGHLRLHEPQGVGGGTQHVVRACTDAQLAGGTMLEHVARGERSRRSERCVPLRGFLVLYLRQSAIHLDLRLRYRRRSDG